MHRLGGPGDGKKNRKNNKGKRDTRHHKPAPKRLKGFPGAERVTKKGGKTRWRNPDGKILEWDKQHGDVEVYNKRGKHLGSARPETGEMYKPPVSGRKIDPIIKVGLGATIIYGGVKVIDYLSSRLTPLFVTPMMMMQVDDGYYKIEQKIY